MKAALLVLALTGCIRDELVTCDNAVACPADLACDDVHGGCVRGEQLHACDALGENDDCTAGPIAGGCLGGVCLPRGCGNRVVEPGEQCDDGNVASYDGCNFDCSSTERCGNGVLDRGEQCDDGNLVSRDGCDSQCGPETPTWTPVVLAFSMSQRCVWYPPHETIACADDRGVWELDGERWSVTPARFSMDLAPTIFFDPDRQQLLATGLIGTGLYAFDGERWTSIEMLATTPGGGSDYVYDSTHHRLLEVVAGDGTVRVNVLANGTSTLVAQTVETVAPMSVQAAYDASTDTVVVTSHDPDVILELQGTVWTRTPLPAAIELDAVLAPVDGHVQLATNQRIFQRGGTGVWNSIAAPIPAGLDVRNLFRADGIETVAGATEMYDFVDGAWVRRHLLVPDLEMDVTAVRDGAWILAHQDGVPVAPAMFTIASGRVVEVDLGENRPAVRQRPLVRGSERHASLLYGGGYDAMSVRLDDFYRFDGTTWTSVAGPDGDPVYDTNAPCAYDPDAGATTCLYDQVEQSLADDGTAWAPSPREAPYLQSLAWDVRQHHLFGTSTGADMRTSAFDANDTDWTIEQLSPLGTFLMTTDARRGSILWLEPDTGLVWERIAGTWQREETIPLVRDLRAAAYDAATGQLVVIAEFGTGNVALVRTWTSAVPTETCGAIDDDGDGLVGCADPDCFWACDGCPPYATCE